MNPPDVSEQLKQTLHDKRQQLTTYRQVLDAMVEASDVSGNQLSRQSHLLAIREADIAYLWKEIHKLQEAQETETRHRQGLIHQLEAQRKHIGQLEALLRQQGYTDATLPPQPPAETPPAPEVVRFSGRQVPGGTPLERQFYAGLDTPKSGVQDGPDSMLHLGGWACDAQGNPPRRVWIAVDQREIPCTLGWKRLDVVKSFQGQLEVAPNCGFNVEIEMRPGANWIAVWAEFASGARHSLMHRTVVFLSGSTDRKGQLNQAYDAWVAMFDTRTGAEAAAAAIEIANLVEPPVLSVLLPTYNTDARLLAECIESVRQQWYPHWQLCIADDASPLPHVRDMLQRYAAMDSRIQIVVREQNGHISAATNSALSLAKGDFCALLDHDDILPPHALLEVARALVANPDLNLIFSDEDKIDEQGNRFDPYFKSDWNPELFLSHNCLSHLGVYRTSILRAIGGFREALSGSQDWDLALRFIAHAGEKGIHHIPKVLYHWRYLDTSTSKSIESKPYAVTAGKQAIQCYLQGKGLAASVLPGTWAGSFRVQYHPAVAPTLSVVLLQHRPKAVEACLRHLQVALEGRLYEVILVTDAPADPVERGGSFANGSVRRVGGLDARNYSRLLQRRGRPRTGGFARLDAGGCEGFAGSLAG
jgi:hypothetical protein